MEKEKRWTKIREQRMSDSVKAAKSLFFEQKIDTVKMTDIAEKSQIGVASLYRYFETKESIAIEVALLAWEEIKGEYLPYFESKEFIEKSGIEQVKYILDIYSDILLKHKDFLLFLSDFDAFCIKEQISKDKLSGYEASIQEFYKPYMHAVQKGKEDETVELRADAEILYLTVNHTMLALLKKIAEGEILSLDSHSADEIEILKDIILKYFKK